MIVAAAEELALGEELAASSSLEDIAAGPRREACGNSRLRRKTLYGRAVVVVVV